MNDAALTLDSMVYRAEHVLFRELDGEMVLLDLSGESYFGLNAVGARAWQLIGEGASLRAIAEGLLAEFDAEAEVVQADLLALADDLARAGLIRVA